MPGHPRVVNLYVGDRYLPSERQSFRPVFLATGVRDVRMSDDSTGKPLRILAEMEDGSFEIFDRQGRPYAPAAPPKG